MKVSELMQAMADAGAPMQAILIAVQALEAKDAEIAARDAEMAEKRAKDAERKRVARASTDSPRTVHGCGADIEAAPLSRPPNENNSNPPTHTPGDIPRARKGTDFRMLDCTDPATWADFLQNRKAKRLPNTASARRKLETDLTAMAAHTGWPPGQVFAACVAKGWGAIYDPRDKTDGKQHSQSSRPAIMDIGRSVAADLEREAAARAGY